LYNRATQIQAKFCQLFAARRRITKSRHNGEIMSRRFFVDDTVTEEGKYRVLQEDSETKESFGVKDFDTKEEAQSTADDLQRAVDNAESEKTTGDLPELPLRIRRMRIDSRTRSRI
jgi:hypothetical protein